MTGMEQTLRYIEREVRFMAKDQFGNATHAKYADRVVQDACGISNFCSTVLASKRPLTAILRAVRGPRGDVIIRFFNVALHDTRVEMVMVLAEAIKLRSRSNRDSRDAHEYLFKLYRKAIKRTVKLITGSKNKESYKSIYRSLRAFAAMDDYEYDEEDDDEYFDTFSEFGDSDYAEECLDIYRSGNIPQIEVRHNPQRMPMINFSDSDEIIKEIAEIQAKLGRELTDRELDLLICGSDEDDENIAPNVPTTNSTNLDSEKMMDMLVDRIYSKVAQKLGITDNEPANESLEDYIQRQSQATQTSMDPKLTQTITAHNDSPASTAESADYGISVDDSTEDSSEEEDSHLPPNDSLGGDISDSETIPLEEDLIVDIEQECPPHLEHALVAGDILTDIMKCKHSELITKLHNHLTRVGVNDNIDVMLVPSSKVKSLVKLIVTVRISGDYEVINKIHLNTVVSLHAKDIAKILDLPEEMVEYELNIIDASTSLNSDLKVLNTLNKDYDRSFVYNIYAAACSLVLYIYRRLQKNTDLRIINSPNHEEIDVYYFSKDEEVMEPEIVRLIIDEIRGENIDTEIFNNFGILNTITGSIAESGDATQIAFFEKLQEVIKAYPITGKYTSATIQYMKDYLINEDNEAEVVSEVDLSTSKDNLLIDIIYRIGSKYEIKAKDRVEFEEQLAINGEYQVCLESVVRAISNTIEVSPYIAYSILSADDESAEEMTSNFGI